jgi:hypothetical protein
VAAAPIAQPRHRLEPSPLGDGTKNEEDGSTPFAYGRYGSGQSDADN